MTMTAVLCIASNEMTRTRPGPLSHPCPPLTVTDTHHDVCDTGVDLPELVAHPPRSMKHTLKKKKGLCKMQNNLVAMMRELQETPFVWNAE